MDLLQERDSRPAPGEAPAGAGGEADGGPRPGDPDCGPAPSPGPGGRSLGALITITVPHTALAGDVGPPGEVAGPGITDHADTRDLVAATARNPATRWCLTTLHPDGTAAAHACAAETHPWPPAQGLPGSTGQGPPGPITLRGLMDYLNITRLTPVIRGPCHHASAEDRYRPSRNLAHLIRARNATCTAPGCSRRAARCDLDHTDSHHHGGRTCECNLAPQCKR